MCEVLEISEKTYYAAKNKKDKDYEDYVLIKEVFEEGKELYGYRRIKKALLYKYGLVMNNKKILRIMNKYNIRVKYKHIFKINYSKKYLKENIQENKIRQNFKAQKENEKWCTDITYLTYSGKTVYLSTILDLYNRKVISYEISKRNNNELVIKTLNNAIKRAKNTKGLIIHSDQGYQYTSKQYQQICKSNNIEISMSRRGNPIDNAPIESFHANLKRETLYSNKIKSIEEYIELVKDWIKFYNTERIR